MNSCLDNRQPTSFQTIVIQGPILSNVCENMFLAVLYFNGPFRPQFCTSRDSTAVVACVKFATWSDTISLAKARCFITKYGLCAHWLIVNQCYCCLFMLRQLHDDVIKWKHFPRYWRFVLGIHRTPGEFPTQRPVTRSFDFFFIYARITGWVNNREAGDLRRHRVHCDVTVMSVLMLVVYVAPIGRKALEHHIFRQQ